MSGALALNQLMQLGPVLGPALQHDLQVAQLPVVQLVQRTHGELPILGAVLTLAEMPIDNHLQMTQLNLPTALKRLSSRKTMILACAGILIYAGIGVLSQTLGKNFLDYHILHKILPATDTIMARSHAMLGVEIGVAFTVSSIMFGLYAYLSSQGREEGGL